MAVYNDIITKYENREPVGYDNVTDLIAIRNSLKNLFTIELGEVPGKPWLGNPISLYLFDNIGFFQERAIESALRNILEKYEPRVTLLSLVITKQEEYNSINVILNYSAFISGREVFENINLSVAHNMLTDISTRTQSSF